MTCLPAITTTEPPPEPWESLPLVAGGEFACTGQTASVERPSRWVPRHRTQEKRRELSSMFRCRSRVRDNERETLTGLGNLLRVAEESCRKHRTFTRTWAAKAKGKERMVKQDGHFIVAKTWACERERGLVGRRVSQLTCSPRCNCNRGGPLIY